MKLSTVLFEENNKNISYTAVVLTKESQTRLLEEIKHLIPNDSNWEIIAHHCTINLKSYMGPRENLNKEYEMIAKSFIMDNKVAAVGVSIVGLTSTNKDTHITIAVNRAMGGKPFLSNKLNWTKAQPLETPIELVGVLQEIEYEK